MEIPAAHNDLACAHVAGCRDSARIAAAGFLFCPKEVSGLWDGYATPRWRKLRKSILRRDKGKCREAARYGMTVKATTVHHIWPAEDYPEYAWKPWNLISLSSKNHDAMHDRFTRKLTELGESWRRRTPPPSIDKNEGAL